MKTSKLNEQQTLILRDYLSSVDSEDINPKAAEEAAKKRQGGDRGGTAAVDGPIAAISEFVVREPDVGHGPAHAAEPAPAAPGVRRPFRSGLESGARDEVQPPWDQEGGNGPAGQGQGEPAEDQREVGRQAHARSQAGHILI